MVQSEEERAALRSEKMVESDGVICLLFPQESFCWYLQRSISAFIRISEHETLRGCESSLLVENTKSHLLFTRYFLVWWSTLFAPSFLLLLSSWTGSLQFLCTPGSREISEDPNNKRPCLLFSVPILCRPQAWWIQAHWSCFALSSTNTYTISGMADPLWWKRFDTASRDGEWENVGFLVPNSSAYK